MVSVVSADGDPVLVEETFYTSQQENSLILSEGYSSTSEIDQLRNELESHLASNSDELNLMLEESSRLLNDRSFDKADQYILSALEDYPNNSDLLVRRAEALAGMNGGSLDGEAFQILSRSLDNDHNHKPSLWLMALFNQQIGNHEAALIILNVLKQKMGDEKEFTDVLDKSIAVSISYIDHMNSPQKNVE